MDIDNERMIKNLDYIYKINLWLIQKYRDDLFKKFDIGANDFLGVSRLFDKIYNEQCKEMPLPWYEYGFGKKEE